MQPPLHHLLPHFPQPNLQLSDANPCLMQRSTAGKVMVAVEMNMVILVEELVVSVVFL